MMLQMVILVKQAEGDDRVRPHRPAGKERVVGLGDAVLREANMVR